MTNTRTPWTHDENRALVALYFSMAFAVEQHQPYVKAAMIRERQTGERTLPNGTKVYTSAPLQNRSRGSIEAKLMNCTAVVEDLGFHKWSMAEHGYRALPNYQAALKVAVADYLRGIGIEVAVA